MCKKLRSNKGFTFIEIMVTLAILSVGLVAIFRSFFVCLDYVNHLTYRLHGLTLLENRLADIEKKYRANGHFNFSPGSEIEIVSINNKDVEFSYRTAINPFEEVPGLHAVDVSILWDERNKAYEVSKTAYFSDVVSVTGL